ncbi:MAG: DUF6359 domain-containing protein [Paludibacteraceae bacterium]|nr:DUF6359 domain-containing protein [Paludibacteraceae bacterium]
MKKIFSLLAAVLFASSTMAAPAQHFQQTVTLSSGSFTAEAGNVPAYITWKAGNDKLTITQLKGTGKSAVNGTYISAPRAYKGHILSFEAETGYSIDTVIITCNGTYYGNSMVAGTAIGEDTLVISNATAIDARFKYASGAKDTLINKTGVTKFYLQNVASAANTQLRFTAIEVRYTKLASSTPEVTVGNLAFGTIIPGLSNATKGLDVIGENISENISASLVDGSNFSISGNLTSAGGTLNVTVTNTANGNYTDKIQFKVGGTLYAESEISARVANTIGKGSKDDPFTISDIESLHNSFSGNYWVKGYILCGFSGIAIDNTANAGLLLGDAMNTTTDTVSVQLPSKSDARTELNVNENASQGWLIKVYGSLESYGSYAGVKNISDFEIISKPATTAISNAEAADTKSVKIIENGQLFIIKNGIKYNAQGTIVK